jgi:uncharacterized protein YdgA (DUF945 family)
MNRTGKTLLAIGGVIVLAYPAVAWMMGLAIESRIQHREQQLLDQAPYLRLVSREYHRGVYRSTEIATYGVGSSAFKALKLTGGAPALPALTLTVASTIEHGPLPGLHALALATIDSTLILPPAVQKELAGILGSTPVLEAHTSIGFFGGASSNLTSPAFNLPLPNGATLAWGGLMSSMRSSGSGASWSGQLTAPRLALRSPQGGIELSGLEYSGSQKKAFDDLYLGTGTLTVEQVKGSSPRAGAFSFERLAVTSTSKPDGQFFDLRVDVSMDAASIAAVQLKNVDYSESFEHIDGPSFASMMRAMRAAQRQAGGNPAQFQAALHDALRQYGVQILLHDPVLDIRQVSFAMPEGSLLLSAKISAPGLSSSDLQWPAAIAALQKHLDVTADLRVDNGLLRKLLAMGGANPKISAQLTSFEQQGYLTAGPAAVTTHVDFSGGKLTLNGHPFPPAPPSP